MSIIGWQLDTVGQIGIRPRLIHVQTNDSLTTITSANYLNPIRNAGFSFQPSDAALVSYISSGLVKTNLFDVSIATDGTITLQQDSSGVIQPVVGGNFAIFANTEGVLEDSGYVPSDPDADRVVMTNATVNVGNVPIFADNQGSLANTSIVGAKVLQWSLSSPDANDNRVSLVTGVTAGALASGPITLLFSSGTKQYIIDDITVDGAVAVNFSGGGGNKSVKIWDGTNLFAAITSTSLETLTTVGNGRLGNATNSYVVGSSSIGLSQRTALGAALVIQYDTGTTNYSLGAVNIRVTATRVA